ncbi:ergosterol biosynthesis ERG4/ERG24 [Multifurca ochricompacta]|uniref:Ergosterol biosynthesis ERG4/ERG24 n=1 Tax=Multifurca ochricompacta TaxID=376703 RepID=A0AAD4M992_9AGAM|nr:ergosterol biosynthesis ERG4/ERG24 [Multifurca ochricompacta]
MSDSKYADTASLNPKTTSYEFFGPLGAFSITIGVPILTYILYFTCNNDTSGGCPPPIQTLYPSLLQALADPAFWWKLWDPEAFALYYSWYTFCLLAWAVLPGDWVRGTQLRNGKYQQYKINAFSTCLLALGLSTGYILRFGVESFTFFYDHWVGFVSAALSMSLFQGILWRKLLALGGNSGNLIYDFYIGRELNPTVGFLDIKSFNELRPGMILWLLIDISMACTQATRLSGQITDSMVLVLFFQGLYILDALYNEPAVLTTMDIISDGFGFMLAVGDLLWARYLVFRPKVLGYAWSAAILAVNFLGYYIFRTSNNEKNEFRNGRNPKNLTYITTEQGSKLLTSGWWAVSRHPNYFGDLLMALAWSLPTGFDTPITYFYVVYFAVLLIHRQRRDDENCEKKYVECHSVSPTNILINALPYRYGKDWHRYQRLVPYRIIPYIY